MSQDKAARDTQAEADELAARKDKANKLLSDAEAEASQLASQTDELRAQAEAKFKDLSLNKDTLEKVLTDLSNLSKDFLSCVFIGSSWQASDS